MSHGTDELDTRQLKFELDELDARQLDLMWAFMRLRDGGAVKEDVLSLIQNLDALRQAMVQKTGGEQRQSKAHDVAFTEIGTYINLFAVHALWLRTTGALDKLAALLPDGGAKMDGGDTE